MAADRYFFGGGPQVGIPGQSVRDLQLVFFFFLVVTFCLNFGLQAHRDMAGTNFLKKLDWVAPVRLRGPRIAVPLHGSNRTRQATLKAECRQAGNSRKARLPDSNEPLSGIHEGQAQLGEEAYGLVLRSFVLDSSCLYLFDFTGHKVPVPVTQASGCSSRITLHLSPCLCMILSTRSHSTPKVLELGETQKTCEELEAHLPHLKLARTHAESLISSGTSETCSRLNTTSRTTTCCDTTDRNSGCHRTKCGI